MLLALKPRFKVHPWARKQHVEKTTRRLLNAPEIVFSKSELWTSGFQPIRTKKFSKVSEKTGKQKQKCEPLWLHHNWTTPSADTDHAVWLKATQQLLNVPCAEIIFLNCCFQGHEWTLILFKVYFQLFFLTVSLSLTPLPFLWPLTKRFRPSLQWNPKMLQLQSNNQSCDQAIVHLVKNHTSIIS